MLDLTRISDALGISAIGAYVLMLALSIILYHLYSKAQTKEAKTSILVSVVIIAAVVVFYTQQPELTKPNENIIETFQEQAWQKEYKMQAKLNLKTYEMDIEDTQYYDINNPEITKVAYTIANESRTADEAVSKTLQYVYNNVEYTFGESNERCFQATSPEILMSGSGQCDTQSMVVISILRKMGIAAKPVGGCYIQNPNCRLQSFAMSVSPGFGKTPIFTDITTLSEDQLKLAGRGVDLGRGALVKSGLHAWVTAWTPKNSWGHYEATNGQMIDPICSDYHVEAFPADDKKEEICTPLTVNYALACASVNYEQLDKYGLGLTTEVNVK